MRMTVVVLVALATLSACGGASHKAASAQAAQSSSAPSSARPGYTPLTCQTVLDTGHKLKGTWTAQELIAHLGTLVIVDGYHITNGTITRSENGMLSGAYLGLEGSRAPSKLESDAQNYAQAEENYGAAGPVNTVYAHVLEKDIAALEKDCPRSISEAKKLADAS